MDRYHQILNLIEQQNKWRSSCINMIASENVTSSAVRRAVSSDFEHRYAEGILGGEDKDTGMRLFKRYYQGTKIFDKVESLAMKMAGEMFKAEHVNVVPISGAIANLTAYYALLNYGDTITGLGIQCGGHISHTHISSAGVRDLRDYSYPFDNEEMNIDIDKSRKMVLEKKPKLMIFGASLFLFPHPLKEMREVADEVGAVIMYDMAHVAGLIAGGKFQKPFDEGADIVTSSTHKTFPGPQGGMVLCKKRFASKINNAAFPGLMSNHHLHHVAGFAVALAEMREFGEKYASQILKNSKKLAQALYERGFDVLCEHKGFTESHQVVIDVSSLGGGSHCATALEESNIIINKNLLPWDDLNKAVDPSGIRIGTQEITRLGMKEDEMIDIADFIKNVVMDGKNVKKNVEEFMKDYTKVHYAFDS